MALHFQCSSNFLQYQILQQPLVNQSDFSSILAKIPSNVFTTRGSSPKQQYKVNVWRTDSVKLLRTCHTNFTFAIRKKIIPWLEWNGLSRGKKFLFYLFFCPCLCPLMHTIIQVAKAPFSPEKVKMLMIVFLLCRTCVCVGSGFLTWGIGMIFRFPLKVLSACISSDLSVHMDDIHIFT